MIPVVLVIMFENSGKGMAQPTAVPVSSQMKPEMTELWVPEVKVIKPGIDNSAPSDAIILFDGKDLNKRQGKDNSESKWQIKDGGIICNHLN